MSGCRRPLPGARQPQHVKALLTQKDERGFTKIVVVFNQQHLGFSRHVSVLTFTGLVMIS
jgi:hypothetical protein